MKLNEMLLAKFGYINQLKKLQEEVGELVEALEKGERAAVKGELADVINMVHQFHDPIMPEIMYEYGFCNKEISDKINQKRRRTYERYFRNENSNVSVKSGMSRSGNSSNGN